VGIAPTFLVAGVVPVVLAAAAVAVFGMRQDELAHPLDRATGAAPAAGTPGA
jgi:hypothetical protein